MQSALTSSETLRRRLLIALAVVGLLVALYLTYIKFNPSSALCTAAGDCEAVNTSVYSEVWGIPIAILGAVAYAALLVSLLLESRPGIFAQWGALFQFGMALMGVLYSAYLTYIEVAVLHKICPYCVTSAVVMLLFFGLSTTRLGRYLN